MSIPKSLEFMTMFSYSIKGWACILLRQSKTKSTTGVGWSCLKGFALWKLLNATTRDSFYPPESLLISIYQHNIS